jgi:hypothetical protein
VPVLGNLDGDDALEIVLPVRGGSGDNRARVLIVDVEPDGSLGTQSIQIPSSAVRSEAVSGIALGNFDDADDGLDICILIGHWSGSWRQMTFFNSTGTDFSFDNTSTGIIAPYCAWNAGMLGAGDFDGDGDHDLIWGQSDHDDDANVVVVEIDASEPDADDKVVSQLDIGNLTGGGVHSLAVYDADGDGLDDAFLLFEDEAEGDLVGPDDQPGGVAVILNPFDLEADAYHLTGFAENGRGLGAGDVNADGIPDIVAGSTKGEFIVFYGDDEGGLANAGRSWTLPSVSGFWFSRSHGLAVGDLNRDGMAEIFMGDLGNNPQALIVWLNQSR